MNDLDRDDVQWENATPYQRQLARAHRDRMRRLTTFWKPPKVKVADPPPPLPDFPKPEPKHSIKINEARWMTVQLIVAHYFNMTRAQLISTSREAPFVQARQIAIWLTRELLPEYSGASLGRRFGKDHTTLIHHMRVKDKRIASNPKLREAYDACRLQVIEALAQGGLKCE